MKLTILNVFDSKLATGQDSPENAAKNVLLMNDKVILESIDFRSWNGFYAVASKMAKSLGLKLIVRNGMALAPYAIQPMVEEMRNLGHLDLDEEPIKLAIHLEGGLVETALSDDPRAQNIELYVYDYDVDEDVEDNEISLITELSENKKQEAFIKKMRPVPISEIGIKLDDVFGAH